ncbi:MAG: type II secretion system protein [Oscillospiraceae bacterium]|nr:type II secretion system protein [Oscillospiraceae bacterium]
MKTNTEKLKGFTLVELIVVIAIIGVLAGILIPSLIGYVNKARRRTDAANAKELYNEFTLMLIDENVTYEGKDGQETVNHCYYHQDYKTVHDVVVNEGTSKEEKYTLHVVAKCAGASPALNQPNQNGVYHWNGNEEGKAIYEALAKNILNAKTKNFPIPIQSKTYNHQPTDLWIIGYRDNDRSQLEIWVGDSTGKWASLPRYRLYPNPDNVYA